MSAAEVGQLKKRSPDAHQKLREEDEKPQELPVFIQQDNTQQNEPKRRNLAEDTQIRLQELEETPKRLHADSTPQSMSNKGILAEDQQTKIKRLKYTVKSQKKVISSLTDDLEDAENKLKNLEVDLEEERQSNKELEEKVKCNTSRYKKNLQFLQTKEKQDDKEIAKLKEAWDEVHNELKKSEEDKAELSEMLRSLRKEGCKIDRALKDERLKNEVSQMRITELQKENDRLRAATSSGFGNDKEEKMKELIITELNDTMSETVQAERDLELIGQITLMDQSTGLHVKKPESAALTEAHSRLEGGKVVLAVTVRKRKRKNVKKTKQRKIETKAIEELQRTNDQLRKQLEKEQFENEQLRVELNNSGIMGTLRQAYNSVRSFIQRHIY